MGKKLGGGQTVGKNAKTVGKNKYIIFTSFHAHVNMGCVGFIPAETESEEAYTMIHHCMDGTS